MSFRPILRAWVRLNIACFVVEFILALLVMLATLILGRAWFAPLALVASAVPGLIFFGSGLFYAYRQLRALWLLRRLARGVAL